MGTWGRARVMRKITQSEGESAQYVAYKSENHWASGQGDRRRSRCALGARVHNGSWHNHKVRKRGRCVVHDTTWDTWRRNREVGERLHETCGNVGYMVQDVT
ncbi:hypothetical protein QJS04_geneDACA021828 [Acorus gramineus]|uniref:Uncharacterized protein n=1 Tax=Acorus gramineus TaxID=55184 RepID=A0AAV9ABL8_ACOGR|nr:hypothetical protein QJS04_geneDACA021828 [Acorus gramineus]